MHRRVDDGVDIEQLEAAAAARRRAPAPATWWWDKRFHLLAGGMALSLGATLLVQKVALAPADDQVTAGAEAEEASAPDAEATDGPADGPTTTAAPAAAGEPAEADPGEERTTTTTPRSGGSTPSGQTPVTVAAGATPTYRPPATTTTAPGPPWKPNPIAVFPPGTAVAGQPVQIGVSVRGIGDSYQVTFGDGGTAGTGAAWGCDEYSLPSAYSHTFASPGRYAFTVRIHGSGGCTTLPRDYRTITKTITIEVVAPS